MKRDWLRAACTGWPFLPLYISGGQGQHDLSEPERLSSPLFFLLPNWALALVLPLYLTLTLCDLTLLVLSWLCKQWNLRLIYETKTCIHHFSGGKTVPPLKDHSGPRECRTFAVHEGWALNVNYTSTQIASWKYQWKRVKHSIILWLMLKWRHTILAEAFILPGKFLKNLLVTNTNNLFVCAACLGSVSPAEGNGSSWT